ncbi:hypothetical protein CF327_g1342 [Tilletia walkeri]|nr:hypothetical protein CF327_g1342 [Tilletia walkeri]
MSAPPTNVKNPQLGSQSLPGHQEHMPTQPCNVCLPAEPSFTTAVAYKPAKKLEGKVVLISGGDSGIGAHIDDASTKGAIIAFTRSLSTQILQKRGIRVNAIAPGSILTPLIETSLTEEQKKGFGKGTPMGRPGQPSEVASCVVFLASPDSSYISGSTLHPNGGEPTNA